MIRTLLLKFWLLMLDLASWANAPHCVYLWIVGRASDATDWEVMP